MLDLLLAQYPLTPAFAHMPFPFILSHHIRAELVLVQDPRNPLLLVSGIPYGAGSNAAPGFREVQHRAEDQLMRMGSVYLALRSTN